MAPLWWKIFLALAIGKPFFQNSEGILRNPVTDRCLHLGYNPAVQKDDVSVFVEECSWTDLENGIQGNRDQWVEVVPATNVHQEHKIQKYNTESLVCVQAVENEKGTSIAVGDCRSSASVFLFKPIPAKTPSLISDPDVIFTIEQPTGKCLTVEPGNLKLGLHNCSTTNPFQRWVACRHVKACDVEISWSPSRIIFPKDPFNSTSDFEVETVTKVVPTESKLSSLTKPVQNQVPLEPTTTTQKSVGTSEEATPTIIINEPIYFIYNSLKIMKLSEKELVQLVANFYEMEELQEALGILNTNRFALDIDPRSRSSKMSLQLVNRVKQVSHTGTHSNIIFASKNLSRVPSPSQVDIVLTNPESVGQTNSKHHQVCPDLNLLTNTIQKHLDLIDHNLSSLKSAFQSNFNTSSIPERTKPVSHTSPNPVAEPEPSESDTSDEGEDINQNIDIRIQPSKKHPKSTIVDKVKLAM